MRILRAAKYYIVPLNNHIIQTITQGTSIELSHSNDDNTQ